MSEIIGYKVFAIQGIIKDRVDQTNGITYHTQKLEEEKFMVIRKANGAEGELIFIPKGSTGLEEIKSEDVKKRRDSYVLRMAMMDWYSRKEGNIIGFPDFYHNWIMKKVKQFNGGEQ